jgi:peptidoglycan/xylan/chitin deacetylase (PgdA/CDA1 family)
VVLAYHRISEPTTDPLELAVAPDQFEEHLQTLSTMGSIVTVHELSQQIRNGTLSDVSFVITFDDGYADNLHIAKPILELYAAPATVFVATKFVGGTPFWWDELVDLMLTNGRDSQLTLDFDGEVHNWRLEQEGRARVHREIYELLRSLDDDGRCRALAALRQQLRRQPLLRHRSLTHEELSELDGDRFIDIGAHTRTHPLLASITDDAARDEICGSKTWLEACIGHRVSAFAYPYGNYGTRDVDLVRHAGFEIAFSTVAGRVEGVATLCRSLA